MVPPSLELFALTFALFKAGAVVVLSIPAWAPRTSASACARSQPEAFIGIPEAHLARTLFRWGARHHPHAA